MNTDAPHIVMYRVLHRHAMATKTLLELVKVLKIVVECVNYMQNSAMKYCIFKELCNEMGSESEVILCHSNVWWFFWGKVLTYVFAMCVELAQFFARAPTLSYRLR